jgi:hypothetical protein
MPVTLDYDADREILRVQAVGKLESLDYERFVPQVENLIEKHGKLDLLLVLEDFHGWTAGALWEDVKFDVKHFNDIRRLAIVGDKMWEKGMAAFCKPFTTAEVRFFPSEQLQSAELWVRGAMAG